MTNKSEIVKGTIRGTPYYMAPELKNEIKGLNEAEYNYKVDIYAFGKSIKSLLSTFDTIINLDKKDKNLLKDLMDKMKIKDPKSRFCI